MRESLTALLAFACLTVTTMPSYAIAISKSGNTVTLSGPINPGDEFSFLDFMQANAADIRIVNLNSPGGKIDPAIVMARYIRSHGLTTLLDASRAKCASACTVLFAAGTSRHYMSARGLSDGVFNREGFIGLGYHEGNSPQSRSDNRYSGAATAQMISMYYEFGSANAADLITKAPPNKLYRVSGGTAISLGLATSEQRP